MSPRSLTRPPPGAYCCSRARSVTSRRGSVPLAGTAAAGMALRRSATGAGAIPMPRHAVTATTCLR